MEHEFLTPIPSVSNERFGEKGRKARRDRGEIYTMRFTDRFIKDQLPGLLLNPPKETSAEKILDASWLLFKQLAEKTSCYRELAAGYNRFCDFIDAGNEAGAWSYPAVARAHQLPLQKLLRDAPWQKNSIALHVLDTAIQRHVAQGDPALFEEPEMLIALLVFYAATLSGICTPPALKALVLTAVSDPEIYCTERWDEAWVLLSIGDAKVTNICVGEERQRVERHFLDPLTVSLISRIASTDLSLDINSIDPNRLIGWINSLAARVGAKGPKFSSPKQFCAVALSIEEQYASIPHALLCAQTGRISTADIPERHWREMLWADPPLVDDIEEPATKAEPLSAGAPTAIDTFSGSASPGAMCTALTRAIKEPRGSVTKAKDRANALKNLNAMSTENWPLSGRLLHAYYVHHLGYKGNKASSVRTYNSEIGRRLLVAMDGKDAFDPDDLDLAYRQVINDEPSDQQQIRAARRLTELHEVGRCQFDLPALYEPLYLGLTAKRHVRAAFVCEAVFSRFLTAIQSIKNLTPHNIERIAVMSIIVYRAGLRPDDVVRLQIRDIEPGKRMTLKVRNNALGSGKTDNAVRIIPLGLLLTADEDKLVRGFFTGQRRRNRNLANAALFNAEGSKTQPIERVFVSNIVGHALKEIKHPGVFYDFRHTAISRLFLIGERQSELLARVAPYSEKRLEAICQAVFGSAYEWHERYRALAAFAGHGSPAITFDHYVHFSSWVVHHALRESSRTFDIRFIANMTGIGATRLRKSASVVGVEDARVRLSEIRPTVLKSHRRVFTLLRDRPSPHPSQPISSPPAQLHTLWDIHAAFVDWENGHSIESILFDHGLAAERFDLMLSVAKALAELKTREGTPRLIPPNRTPRERQLVVPALPSGNLVRRDAEILVKRFREAYRDARDETSAVTRDDIAWAIMHWLKNSITSEPYARFADKDELRRFLKVTSVAIPSDRWRIEFYVGHRQGLDKIVEAWRIPKRFDVGEIKAKGTNTKAVAHVYLKHPNDRELVAQLQEKLRLSKVDTRQYIVRRYSAYTLRFVFHMMAIVLLSPSALEQ